MADEFRDGNVPAAKGTLAVTKKAFAALRENIEERFFRGDSACYNTEQMVWLESQNIGFSISADMHPMLKKTCKSVVESSWRLMETRATEQLHVSESIHFPANCPTAGACNVGLVGGCGGVDSPEKARSVSAEAPWVGAGGLTDCSRADMAAL